MTHRHRELGLNGSTRNDQPLRVCQGSCQVPRKPEGGTQMSATKWVCGACAERALRRFR